MPGLGHIAVGVAAGRLYCREEAETGALGSRCPATGSQDGGDGPRSSAEGGGFGALAASMVAFSVLSVLPDADVVAFALGIPYDAPFGHRGAFHSVAVGLAAGVVVGWLARLGGSAWGRTTLIACLVAASHGLLDTLTDGGRGIAVLWPLTDQRYFAPWRPIPVSPIGPAVFSEWGLRVVLTELWLFAPLWLYAFWPRRSRRGRR